MVKKTSKRYFKMIILLQEFLENFLLLKINGKVSLTELMEKMNELFFFSQGMVALKEEIKRTEPKKRFRGELKVLISVIQK